MTGRSSIWSFIVLFCSFATVLSHLESATILHPQDLQQEYDFLIVGGGTAGLTVADRLSENGKFTVLVVEYGYNDTSSSIRSVANVTIPLDGFPEDPNATPDQFPPATRMYNTTSIPQPALNNRSTPIEAGSVLGGSSAINGMYFDRGSIEDYDSWVVAAGEHSAEYGIEWGWNNILPYFKKSVSFQPPTPFMVENYNMTSDVEAAYGGHTHIHSCYPPYQWPGLFPASRALGLIPGVEFPVEGAAGTATGAFFVPNSIVPNIRLRSYSVSGHYLDENGPVTRNNFHLIPAHRVTRVILTQVENGTGTEPLWQAEGVIITPRDPSQSQNPVHIKARKEVIISAGSLHTPQVLQRSGIGPRDILEAANVSVKVELPGVGQNLQDHAFFSLIYNYTTPVLPNRASLGTNATFRAEATEQWNNNRTGPYSSYVSHGAFLPLSVISNRTESLVETLLSQDAASFFPPGTHESVIKGYEVRRNASAQQLLSSKSAVLEVPFDGDGFFSVIFLKPQSRGTVFIAKNDDGATLGTMDPLVDWQTIRNPVDVEICLDMMRFWRYYHETPAMQETFAPVELTPGANVTSDEDLIEYFRETILSSNGHLVGTAALGPRELSGVVGPDLTVHGTLRLSVADNSVMPLVPGTHTSATAYAIAEKASVLILGRHS